MCRMMHKFRYSGVEILTTLSVDFSNVFFLAVKHTTYPVQRPHFLAYSSRILL